MLSELIYYEHMLFIISEIKKNIHHNSDVQYSS